MNSFAVHSSPSPSVQSLPATRPTWRRARPYSSIHRASALTIRPASSTRITSAWRIVAAWEMRRVPDKPGTGNPWVRRYGRDHLQVKWNAALAAIRRPHHHGEPARKAERSQPYDGTGLRSEWEPMVMGFRIARSVLQKLSEAVFFGFRFDRREPVVGSA